MDEINSNQDQELNSNNNVQEINQFYSNKVDNIVTNEINLKKLPKKYIIGASVFLILFSLVFGILSITLPLLWLIYWSFKFYEKISWQRYNLSFLSLIIVSIIGFYTTFNWYGSNDWNFLPLIYVGVVFILLIIWSIIIVPIFILYHNIRAKNKSNNTDLINNMNTNVQDNESINEKPLNYSKNTNLLITISLILFFIFILNLIISSLFGFSLLTLFTSFFLPRNF
jgi:hypothetical protein